ncbi:MAG: class I SAM-dependent DNA methyltransferase [Anaerolinea sp.]|nr:class I SAM-dependent DNA methyltransferase [Anaerolinea sp.]
MPPTLTPQAFVAKWRKSELKESAADREHFIDLCRLIGHETPAEADATGVTFTFQYGAAKLGGGQGFADVFKRGFFGWEYKGKHANLDKAYQQLLQYRESLHNPPLLVVSDFERIVVYPNFVNRLNQPTTLTLDDLLTPAGMASLRAIFYDPAHFESGETRESVTQRMAGEFAQLADRLRAAGHEPPQVARFLIRLLFCLFAEDAGLLPDSLFSRLVTRTRRRPEVFSGQLRQLFAAMAGGGWFGVDQVPHFNGGLFDDDRVLALDEAGLEVLAGMVPADWAAIEPSIFGTLFERGLDPAKRSQLGAHFTSREDILLVVEPVLMAPLRRRWVEVQAQADLLAQRRDAVKGQKRANLDKQLQNLLLDFALELARVRVLDPACGSGNFLYLALLSLLDLWKEVYNQMLALGLTGLQPLPGLAPSPGQLYGIEINEYAHELAQATIAIGYIQWLRNNGFGHPPEPILQPLQTVRRMDAILALPASDSPLPPGEGPGVRALPTEPEWPAVDVIIGNPPFLGGKRLRSELGDTYVDALFRLYDGRVPRECDLVCYWFEKARAQIETGKAQRAGLLATQAIRGGANRKVLERIKETGDIFWAESDRNWILDGATVHVSMVGFDTGNESSRILNGQQVTVINPNLAASVDLTKALRLRENANLSFMGVTPAGSFDIPEALARSWMALPLNPNGRPNSDVLRPYFNGIDLTRRPRDVWIIDFGVGTSLEEAALYQEPFEYVIRNVKTKRLQQRSTISQWWLHERPRPEMRNALVPLSRYIGTSMVSKHFLFSWIPSKVLPANLLIVVARDDDYFFGVLHSKPHELWARGLGTQLREAESGFRYTPTTTFETFPFPWPPGQEPVGDARVEAIAAAARELVRLRDAWLNPPDASEAELKKRTLTNLYNARPTWLDHAHRQLDAAVCAAYGWPADLDDEAILERLLALNLERAGR